MKLADPCSQKHGGQAQIDWKSVVLHCSGVVPTCSNSRRPYILLSFTITSGPASQARRTHQKNVIGLKKSCSTTIRLCSTSGEPLCVTRPKILQIGVSKDHNLKGHKRRVQILLKSVVPSASDYPPFMAHGTSFMAPGSRCLWQDKLTNVKKKYF